MKQPAQKKLEQAIHTGAHGQGVVAAEQVTFADNRPAALVQRKLANMMDNGPRAAAQRQKIARISGAPVQKLEAQDDGLLQGKFASEMASTQLQADVPPKANNTGLPDNLKAGIENLSGMAMDDVKVHYNSDKPAQLQALAYAQGSDIHVGPGQEQHVPHEAWHVVQQKQGRVQPTMQAKVIATGVPINDDRELEQEADAMGAHASALGMSDTTDDAASSQSASGTASLNTPVLQGYFTLGASAIPVRGVPKLFRIEGLIGPNQQLQTWAEDKIDHHYESWDKAIDAVLELHDIGTAHGEMSGDDLEPDLVDRPYRGLIVDNLALDEDDDEEDDTRLSGAPLLCMQAMFTEEYALLSGMIVAELGATEAVDSAGIVEFSKAVTKRMDAILQAMDKWAWKKVRSKMRFGTADAYVECDEGASTYDLVNVEADKFMTVFHRAIWAEYGNYFEEEIGMGSGNYKMGTKKSSANVGGFLAHFTNRTEDDDVDLVSATIIKLNTLMAGLTGAGLATEILQHIGVDMATALDEKDTATGNPINQGVNEATVVAATEAATPLKVRAYADNVVTRWAKAKNGKINLVFDRAKLKDVFGQSTFNADATPANMMKTDDDGLSGLKGNQRITINLDATNEAEIFVTLAHEIAHSIGFNPTDCEATGHFADSRKYTIAEGLFGPKLLFDAYYFETLIKRLGT